MNKIKKTLVLIIFAVVIYACGDDNVITNPYANIDYEALAVSDNDSIVKFLGSHYYDANLDSIKPLVSGETSMLDDNVRLIKKEIKKNDITFTLYTYVINQGNPMPYKGFPSVIDSVFTNYKGIQLLNNNIDASPFDSGSRVWLTNTITGWANGFTNFKGGENITNNGPITFKNTGKGYLFIPSGLGYSSINYQLGQQTNFLFDNILVFQVELLDHVEDTDHDNDGTPSINEDANGDGDPTNDFSDTNNPTVPDYLNPNIK